MDLAEPQGSVGEEAQPREGSHFPHCASCTGSSASLGPSLLKAEPWEAAGSSCSHPLSATAVLVTLSSIPHTGALHSPANSREMGFPAAGSTG